MKSHPHVHITAISVKQMGAVCYHMSVGIMVHLTAIYKRAAIQCIDFVSLTIIEHIKMHLRFVVIVSLPWKGIQTNGTWKNKKKWAEKREEEECPGVLQQSFVLARSISIGFTHMNPTLIG